MLNEQQQSRRKTMSCNSIQTQTLFFYHLTVYPVYRVIVNITVELSRVLSKSGGEHETVRAVVVGMTVRSESGARTKKDLNVFEKREKSRAECYFVCEKIISFMGI